MIVRSLALALTLAIGCFLAPMKIQACGCSKAAPGACQGLAKDDVVFLGTVTDVEILPPSVLKHTEAADDVKQSPGPDNANGEPTAKDGALPGETPTETPITRYHFRMDEKFSGPDTADIDVFSGGDDGDCGYRFEKGAQYVVFTQQEVEGRLFATICNGTRPASDARALIPQLRAMRNGTRVASVFGVLRRTDPPFLSPPDDPDDPMPNIAIRLRSRDDRFSTNTGPDGVYSLYDVHAGEYRFTANLPARMELTQKTLTGGLPPFKIPNGACYEYDVDGLPTGHMQGSVLGPDGKPQKLASVELYRAGQYTDSRPGLWRFQGAKGVFDFDHIGPGTYILVYNRANRVDPSSPFLRTFYPGVADLADATAIQVKDGQQLLRVNIKLGEGYPVRPFRVHVTWEHGRPAGSVTVMARADGTGLNPAAEKISEELYEFTLLQSGRYTISAWEDLDPQRAVPTRHGQPSCSIPARIETMPVEVDASDTTFKDVTLVFAAVGCTSGEQSN